MRGLEVLLFLAITAVYLLAVWHALPRSQKSARRPHDRTDARR